MKNFIKYKIGALAFSMLVLAACDEQEVEAPMDPATKPTVTITRIDDAGSIEEGDTLIFEITTSKMLEHNSVAFVPSFADVAEVEEGLDYDFEGGVLAPFTTSTTLTVYVYDDGFPEADENFNFEIVAPNWGQSWQLNPQSDVEVIESSVANVNDPESLTIAFGWDDPEHHSDFDLLVNYGETSWGAAASSANPEIDNSISHNDEGGINVNDGTYYVGVDPYDVPDEVTSYTISVGYPDGRVETFQGTFDQSKLDSYPTDYFAAYETDMYRMLVVEKNGDQYTVDFVHD